MCRARRRSRRKTTGRAHTGTIRLLHSLDRAILDQLIEIAEDLGGAERLTVASPFQTEPRSTSFARAWHLIMSLYIRMMAARQPRSVGLNWPVKASTKVDAVELDLLGGDGRPLHAKAFEIVCRRGRLLVSGSANATMAALAGNAMSRCVWRVFSATPQRNGGSRRPRYRRFLASSKMRRKLQAHRGGSTSRRFGGRRDLRPDFDDVSKR